MSHIIFDVNDIGRLRNELRLTNEYAEKLEDEIEYLKDRLYYERDPSTYNRRKGHSAGCIRVFAPRSLFPCDCRLETAAK